MLSSLPGPSCPMTTTPIPSQLKHREETSATLNSDWFTPFEPPSWLRGGHAQTLSGNYWRRVPTTIPFEPETVEVDARDGSRVLCHCHWQAEQVRCDRLTILLV